MQMKRSHKNTHAYILDDNHAPVRDRLGRKTFSWSYTTNTLYNTLIHNILNQ